MSNTRQVAQSFSRGGVYYDRSAAMQRAVAMQLLSSYQPKIEPKEILEIGAGTGFLTRCLAGRFPASQIHAIDSARGMLEVCAGKFGGQQNVSFHLAEASTFPREQKYDLIASSSALQWIVSRQQLFEQLRLHLKPSGRLIFSVMLSGTLGELRKLRSELFPNKTGRDWLPTAGILRDELAHSGCVLERFERETRVEYFSDARALLTHLSASGTSGAGYGNSALNRGELAALCEAYDERFASNGGRVTATYEIAYFEAQ